MVSRIQAIGHDAMLQDQHLCMMAIQTSTKAYVEIFRSIWSGPQDYQLPCDQASFMIANNIHVKFSEGKSRQVCEKQEQTPSMSYTALFHSIYS